MLLYVPCYDFELVCRLKSEMLMAYDIWSSVTLAICTSDLCEATNFTELGLLVYDAAASISNVEQ